MLCSMTKALRLRKRDDFGSVLCNRSANHACHQQVWCVCVHHTAPYERALGCAGLTAGSSNRTRMKRLLIVGFESVEIHLIRVVGRMLGGGTVKTCSSRAFGTRRARLPQGGRFQGDIPFLHLPGLLCKSSSSRDSQGDAAGHSRLHDVPRKCQCLSGEVDQSIPQAPIRENQ